MKNRLILTLLLVSVSLLLKAQDTNYKEAFVILNNGDKLEGIVDFRTDDNNAKQCLFKKDEKSEVQIFTPETIKEYKFPRENKYYVAYDVEIDSVKHRYFLEYLVKGQMNLYYLVHNNQKYYFFEDEGGKMQSVTKVPDKVVKYTTVKDNKYKGMLRYIFRDYADIKEEIDKTKYFSQAEMIDIAKMYHDKTCTTGAECIIYQNTKPDAFYRKYNFSIYGGVQFFNYSFDKNFPVDINSQSSASPMIGVRLFLNHVRWSKSFSYGVDLSVSKMKLNKKNMKPKNNEFEYSPIVANARIGGKYVFLKNKIKPTIEAGISNFIIFDKKANYHDFIKREDESISEFVREIQMPNYLVGPYVSVGFDYAVGKHFLFINALYEAGFSAKKTKNANNSLQSPHIKLGFTL